MKIEKTDNGYSLIWEYAIKSNMTVKDEKEYWFYTTTFPGELYTFFNADIFYLYIEEGRFYLSPDEPAVSSYKVKLFQKGNQPACNMTLSKKVFKWDSHVQGKVKYTLYLLANPLLEVEPLL